MGNCNTCTKNEPLTLDQFRQVLHERAAKLEPLGAGNNPRITIDLDRRQGVACHMENVTPRDAFDLLQGCWLAAGEMFDLLDPAPGASKF